MNDNLKEQIAHVLEFIIELDFEGCDAQVTPILLLIAQNKAKYALEALNK